MYRILVDNGSFCSILSLSAFNQIGIDHSNLKAEKRDLIGFSGDHSPIVGSIVLPMILGTPPRVATEIIEFLVIDMPKAYNGCWPSRFSRDFRMRGSRIGISRDTQMRRKRNCYIIFFNKK